MPFVHQVSQHVVRRQRFPAFQRAVHSLLLCLATLLTFSCGDPQSESSIELAARGRSLEVDSFAVSGTVFGGDSALAGAVVDALANGTTTVVATSTSDTSGDYSLALNDGTYDLRVTPPPGRGLDSYLEQDVVVDGATVLRTLTPTGMA